MAPLTIKRALVGYRHTHTTASTTSSSRNNSHNIHSAHPLIDLVAVTLSDSSNNGNANGDLILVVGDFSLQGHECARVHLKAKRRWGGGYGREDTTKGDHSCHSFEKGDIVLFQGLSIRRDYGGSGSYSNSNSNSNSSYSEDLKEKKEEDTKIFGSSPSCESQVRNIEKLVTVVCDFHHSFSNPHTSHASFHKLATVHMDMASSTSTTSSSTLRDHSNLLPPVIVRNRTTGIDGLIASTHLFQNINIEEIIHNVANWFRRHHLQSGNQSTVSMSSMSMSMSVCCHNASEERQDRDRYQKRRIRDLIVPHMKSDVWVCVTQITNVARRSIPSTSSRSSRYKKNATTSPCVHFVLMDATNQQRSDEEDFMILIVTLERKYDILRKELTELYQNHGTCLLRAVLTQWSNDTGGTCRSNGSGGSGGGGGESYSRSLGMIPISKKMVFVPTPETSIDVMSINPMNIPSPPLTGNAPKRMRRQQRTSHLTFSPQQEEEGSLLSLEAEGANQQRMVCMATLIQVKFQGSDSNFEWCDANIWPKSEQTLLDLWTVTKEEQQQQHTTHSSCNIRHDDASAQKEEEHNDLSTNTTHCYSYRSATLTIQCLKSNGQETGHGEEDREDSMDERFKSKQKMTINVTAPPRIISALCGSYSPSLLRNDALKLQRASALFHGLLRWNVPLHWSLTRTRTRHLHEEDKCNSRRSDTFSCWTVDDVSMPSMNF